MQDEVRKQLFDNSEKFQLQLDDAIDQYAKFQRGIVQNDIKLTDEDKLQWLLMCRKLRKLVTEKLKLLDDHTVIMKNYLKIKIKEK